MTHVIYAKSFLTYLNDENNSAYIRRLKALVNDVQRESILFPNDTFSGTYMHRTVDQADHDYYESLILKLGQYYHQHWFPLGISILIITENDLTRQKAQALGLSATSLQSFLTQHKSDYPELLDLYQSISYILTEKDTVEGVESQEFQSYQLDDALQAGVKSGTIFQGSLQVNRYQVMEAFVRLQTPNLLGTDIYIPNRHWMNRAIHGDTVYVQLLQKSEWEAPISAFYHEGEEEDPHLYRNTRNSTIPCGKVVGIAQRKRDTFVCSLHPDLSDSTNKWQLAIPWDIRIPRIRIQTRQMEALKSARFEVRLDHWEPHSKYPHGHYVRKIGDIGVLETDVQSLLLEYDIRTQKFSETMMESLPSPNEDFKFLVDGRRDLRDTLIFSVDPIGAEDIDDALSCERLENGLFRVGVHIADVNAFLKENSPLDLEARLRGTSVYLADRRIDMLPQVLSTYLCSLRVNVDRYAVSVLWDMDAEANIHHTWYGRTLIRSASEMNYELAQQIVEGATAQSLTEQDRRIVPLKDLERIRTTLTDLRDLYRIIRAKRMSKGALQLESVEIKFKLDAQGQPIEAISKQRMEIHQVIEEFMIFANVSVAKFIFSQLPTQALLRMHAIPKDENFENLLKAAQSKGFEISTASNWDLSLSLAKMASESDDPLFIYFLKSLSTLSMTEAVYFSSNQVDVHEFYHYGLALEIYTHFTSPIRRYADTVVHRLLLKALNVTPMEHNDVESIASHLNMKNKNAKYIQRETRDLYLSLYLRDKEVNEIGIITQIKENGWMVYVPKYGIRGKLYLKDKGGKNLLPEGLLPNREDPSKAELIVNKDMDAMTIGVGSSKVEIRLFDYITVKVCVKDDKIHMPTFELSLIKLGYTSKMMQYFLKKEKTNIQGWVLEKKLIEEQEAWIRQIEDEEEMFKELGLFEVMYPSKTSIYELMKKLKHLTLKEPQSKPRKYERKLEFQGRRTFRYVV